MSSSAAADIHGPANYDGDSEPEGELNEGVWRPMELVVN